MPSMKVEGLDEVYSKLKALADGNAIEAVQKHAVYKGMEQIKQEMEAQIRALPEQEGYVNVKKGQPPRSVITKREKEQLLKHLGISKMEEKNGSVYNSISFDGYTDIKTKKYPNGVPAVLIARSINSGSSVRQKKPFVRQAKAAAQNKATEAAKEAAYDSLNKIMEGS